MLTRREVLIGAAAAGVAMSTRRATVLAGPSQPATPVNFQVPSGACDCHVHLFGDPTRFPFSPVRTYTPEPASVEQLRALRKALHTDRTVVVQPSVYGTDNACTLDAIRQLGRGARGIAVIDEKTSDDQLDAMDRGGIRGIRINLGTTGQTDPDIARQRFRSAANRIKDRRWHIQMFTQLSVIEAISD